MPVGQLNLCPGAAESPLIPVPQWELLFFTFLFHFIYLFIYLFFFWLFAFATASPAAYGGSQARGRIGAVATGLRQSHSNVGSEPRLQPTPQLMATPDR